METTSPPVTEIAPTTMESTQLIKPPRIVDSTTVPVNLGTPSFTTITLQPEESSSTNNTDTTGTRTTTSLPHSGIHHSPPPDINISTSTPEPAATTTNNTSPFPGGGDSNNPQAAGNLAKIAVPSVIGGLALFGAVFAAVWWVYVVRVTREKDKERGEAEGQREGAGCDLSWDQMRGVAVGWWLAGG